jgi:hypothetical protein
MKFSWSRWRLLVACLTAGLVLPVITVVQALRRAEALRAKNQLAGEYLRTATFGSDTVITLAIWTLEIAAALYRPCSKTASRLIKESTSNSFDRTLS